MKSGKENKKLNIGTTPSKYHAQTRKIWKSVGVFFDVYLLAMQIFFSRSSTHRPTKSSIFQISLSTYSETLITQTNFFPHDLTPFSSATKPQTSTQKNHSNPENPPPPPPPKANTPNPPPPNAKTKPNTTPKPIKQNPVLVQTKSGFLLVGTQSWFEPDLGSFLGSQWQIREKCFHGSGRVASSGFHGGQRETEKRERSGKKERAREMDLIENEVEDEEDRDRE